MKKYTLLLTVLLTALIALNGCTLFTTYKVIDNEDLPVEKEVFAQDENETALDKTVSPVSEPHKFTVEAYEGELKADDGALLATYDYSYPVFECNEGDNAEYIETINEMFKDNALYLASGAENNYELLAELYEGSKNNGYRFSPYDYSYSFEIHTDAKGILSVTEAWYYYSGGAHGSTLKGSHTFDVVNGKELSLSDLLYGTDEEITEAFTQEFLEVRDAFFGDPSEIVPAELPSAQYYVDSEGVTAYFQQYQVGPYASGFVSATISDKEMLKFDFSDTEKE